MVVELSDADEIWEQAEDEQVRIVVIK